MGNSTSTTLNTKKSTITALAQAYMTLSQDISQGINAEQTILAKCDEPVTKDFCLKCISETKAKGYTPEQVDRICQTLCKCKISNVKFGQRVFYNSKIFQRNDTGINFETQFLNSLSQQASSEDTGIKLSGNSVKNISENINSVRNYFKSDVFQSAMEQLKQQQDVTVIGAGNIYDVDFTQAVDYVSNVIQKSSSLSDIISSLQITVLQMATEVTISGLDQLIIWIIRIVVALVVLVTLFYAINLIFQIYSLYVQK